MIKTIIIAAASMVGGAALGYVLCGAAYRKLRRKFHAVMNGEKKGMGVMDKILVIEAVVLVLYTITDFIVFWHTGSEPSTLTACVFSVCGLENGVMGWIKTNKEKLAAGPPSEPEEPPDAG